MFPDAILQINYRTVYIENYSRSYWLGDHFSLQFKHYKLPVCKCKCIKSTSNVERGLHFSTASTGSERSQVITRITFTVSFGVDHFDRQNCHPILENTLENTKTCSKFRSDQKDIAFSISLTSNFWNFVSFC